MDTQALLTHVVERLAGSQSVRVYLHPLFLLTIGLTFFFEWRRPARRSQGVFSIGLAHDLVYFPVLIAARFVIEATYVVLLRHLYDRWLDDTLTIRALASWSPAARVTVGVVVGDFVAWFHHWLRHQVPLFWRFHAVHHSQREMNVFTDQRYHPFEYLVTTSVRALPMFMLGASVPTVLGVSLATEMLTKFYHGNVRTNFGPLRYLLVTPQSHRIHHSIELQHRDSNYGVIFALWDRLFGTQHPSSDVYPETGVTDPGLPRATSRRPAAVARTFLRELWYPFARRAA